MTARLSTTPKFAKLNAALLELRRNVERILYRQSKARGRTGSKEQPLVRGTRAPSG